MLRSMLSMSMAVAILSLCGCCCEDFMRFEAFKNEALFGTPSCCGRGHYANQPLDPCATACPDPCATGAIGPGNCAGGACGGAVDAGVPGYYQPNTIPLQPGTMMPPPTLLPGPETYAPVR